MKRPPTSPARVAALVLLGGAALGLASPAAQAAFPEDLTLSQLDQYDGEPYTDDAGIQEAWATVARNLGTGIANQPMGASTLGLNGFELSLGTTVTFVDASRSDGSPTAWQRVREGNQAAGPLFVPGLHLRKGLPLSFEVGGHMGWMGFTRQAVFGGYGRFAPLESFDRAPEIAIQAGYSGYVGNDELDLGVSDLSLSIGKTFPVDSGQGVRTSTIHPFLAVAGNWIRATPTLSPARLSELGISPLRASKQADSTDTDGGAIYHPDMSQLIVAAGLRVVSGDIGMRVGLSVPTASVPNLEASLGYVF